MTYDNGNRKNSWRYRKPSRYSPRESSFFIRDEDAIPKRGEPFDRKLWGKKGLYICLDIIDTIPMFGYRIVKMQYRLANKKEKEHYKKNHRICKECGKSFIARTYNQCFCCRHCNRVYWRKHQRNRGSGTTDLHVIREFICKECGKQVWVNDKTDQRTVFCCQECEKQYWKHGYLQANKHVTSSNNLSAGMSLGSLIRRERMDEA